MNSLRLKLLMILVVSLISNATYSQCLYISCPADTNASNDPGDCGAIVNYTEPIAVDTCSLAGDTFNFTGSVQTYVVPANVTSITVDLYGAEGGGDLNAIGGLGGQLQASYPVNPGETLNIYVGGQGDVSGTAGYNGGGAGIGGSVATPGSGGGGASDIRIGGTGLGDRVLVAGGGGGGTDNAGYSFGGDGGGLTGGSATCGNNPWGCTNLTVATGGTQAAGGLGGTSASCGWNGSDGTLGVGGNSYTNYRCSGGGGGYYGGGGGHNGCGGGGGSNYADASASGVVHTQGVNTGDGMVVISYPGQTVTATLASGLPSGSLFPVGTSVVTYAVSDTSGNTDSCSFNVIVADTEAPTITCPSDVSSCEPNPTGIAPMATDDNCSVETITYSMSGATVNSGNDDVSGESFNVGTTTVTYTVADASGNSSSCDFEVEVKPSPMVAFAAFEPDTVCVNHPEFSLPQGTPSGGIYAGVGVSGSNFDPAVAGDGSFVIVYSYTDTNGCGNTDSSTVVVSLCLGTEDGPSMKGVQIYPNPTNGQFVIDLRKHSGAISYSISALDGRVIQEQKNVSSSLLNLDLGQERKGVYIVRLEGKESTHTYRLIKQ